MKEKIWFKILVIGATVLVLGAIIIVALSFNYFFRHNKDTLISYIPPDATAYVHFNYQPGEQNEKQKKFFQYFFNDIGDYLQQEKLLTILSTSDYIDDELGLFFDQKNNFFLVVKLNHHLQSVLETEQDNFFIDNNVLVIAKTDDLAKNFSHLPKRKNQTRFFSRRTFIRVDLTDKFILNNVADKNYAPIKKFLEYKKINNLALEFDSDFSFSFPAGLIDVPDMTSVILPRQTKIAFGLGNKEYLRPIISLFPDTMIPGVEKLFTMGGELILLDYNSQEKISFKNPEYILIKNNLSVADFTATWQNLFSKEFPLKRTFNLPDGGQVIENFSSLKDNNFYQTTILGQKLMVLVAEDESRMSYSDNNGVIVAGNSPEKLAQYLQKIDETIFICQSFGWKPIKIVVDFKYLLPDSNKFSKYQEIFKFISVFDGGGCLK